MVLRTKLLVMQVLSSSAALHFARNTSSLAAPIKVSFRQTLAPRVQVWQHHLTYTPRSGVHVVAAYTSAAIMERDQTANRPKRPLDQAGAGCNNSNNQGNGKATASAPQQQQGQQGRQDGKGKKQKRFSDPAKQVAAETSYAIQQAAKTNDLRAGLALLQASQANGTKLATGMCNTLLYLASGAESWEKYARGLDPPAPAEGCADPPSKAECIAAGAAVWGYMQEQGLAPDHATFTALARLAAIKGEPAEARRWAQQCIDKGLNVHLRLFHPALVGYCLAGRVEEVMQIDADIAKLRKDSLDLTEYEFARLLEVLCKAGSHQQVEAVLLRMKQDLNTLSAPTLALLEGYFKGERAQQALGGSGQRWELFSCQVDESGHHPQVGARLQVVDLREHEWDEFAQGVASLALRNENDPRRQSEFKQYQQWYARYGPYDILIDGANVAFYGQNRAGGGFSWGQIMAMWRLVGEKHPGSKALLMLHKKRLNDPEARQPAVQQFVEQLRKAKAFFHTPPGSNDDWYWLYATVKAQHKGLLISNDELRDHIFTLLRPKHFLKWKERHIVHYNFTPEGIALKYPAQYTACVQQLENGAWMFPGVPAGNGEGVTWLCAKPVGAGAGSGEGQVKTDANVESEVKTEGQANGEAVDAAAGAQKGAQDQTNAEVKAA